MYDETRERMRKDRDTTKRAECFSRLVLANREDHDGRKLLNYAERTADRLPMQWEKTIAWLSLSLRGDRVDETTLTGIGFKRQEVRHATVVQPRKNETAMAYAERLAAYNEPEVFAVGEAMLDETADTNPTVPTTTTNTARNAAIDRVRTAHKDWAQAHAGERPPAGGVADERPTAPGIATGPPFRECSGGPFSDGHGVLFHLATTTLETDIVRRALAAAGFLENTRAETDPRREALFLAGGCDGTSDLDT